MHFVLCAAMVFMYNCYDLHAYIITPNCIYIQLDDWSCLDYCSCRASCMLDERHMRTK